MTCDPADCLPTCGECGAEEPLRYVPTTAGFRWLCASCDAPADDDFEYEAWRETPEDER